MTTTQGSVYVLYCDELLKEDPMKFYVGSTWQRLHNRLMSHRNDSRDELRKSSLYLAMRKYGEENFEMDLLETVEVPNTTRRERDRALCKHEQRWMDKFKAEEGVRPKLNDKDAYLNEEAFKKSEAFYKTCTT